MSTAELIVFLIEIYLGAGLLVALAFIVFGIERVEPYAKGSLGFRPLLVPGLTLLWPLVIWRWWVLETGKETET
ncbi:MAG: hypothetical protein AAGA53_16400 [Pseudomonadota bacterium]